uniref:Uncharacterized protein n=1 Tax=Globodera rostochiensis TaxID=31243 RepID=A0A914IBT6_GLORO
MIRHAKSCRFSTSPIHSVRQRNGTGRRETDFLQPTSKIASPAAACVIKNYFVTFGFVEQSDVGKAVQVVEYHLNGDIKARLIFTLAELREVYELVKQKQIALMEGREAFSPIEKFVEQTKLSIWLDTECGLRVLRISHSTPFYRNLRPLVIPIYNLKEFVNELENVLMSEQLQD